MKNDRVFIQDLPYCNIEWADFFILLGILFLIRFIGVGLWTIVLNTFSKIKYIDALLKDIRNIKQHYPEIKRKYSGELISDLGDGGDEDFDRYFLQKIVHISDYHWCKSFTTWITFSSFSS